MKVLMVNSEDISGGAAIASYRLHCALCQDGIDSQMLVLNKKSDDFTVIESGGKLRNIVNQLLPTLDGVPKRFYPNKLQMLFSVSWQPFSNIVEKINEINPDIVHLHWICGGMIRIEDLLKIKASIVWSLHDNWAFTGGCHIMWDCQKYKEDCGACPRLGSESENDLSRKIYNRKYKIFSKMDNLTLVGLSRWLENCAKESSLFKNKKVVNLPNLIDTDSFKPFDKEKSRELWNLPKDKKLILFGAMGATSDINKGFNELRQALNQLKTKDIELVVFGSSEPRESQHLGYKTHYIGHLHDSVSLVTLYSAVDVMVVPSRQEAFGQIASESMACGTPVVAFGHTGLLDIVDHQHNGYLAKPFDIIDLANGIDWVLNSENYDNLYFNARKKVLLNFSSEIVVPKYIELYEEILHG